jgi:hypothetical protein
MLFRMARLFVFALLLLSIAPTIAAQQVCNSSALQGSATQAARLRSTLRAQTVGTMETDVPHVIQNRLVQFKNALANVVEGMLACQNPSATPTQIQSALAHQLHANGAEPSDADELARSNQDEATDEYGTPLRVRVRWQSTTLHLLAIEIELGIPCGEDTMLFIFEPLKKNWVERLRWQAPKYDKVGDAFGDFFLHTLVQPQGSNTWQLAIAHGRPWCTSRFSGFAIDLLEPTANAAQPHIVWHTERGYSRGDFETSLKASGNIFELRINDDAMHFDTDRAFERRVIYRYRVNANTVDRIEPIALNARGFVEEWLDMPWAEAAAQTTDPDSITLKRMHESYQREWKEQDNTFIKHAYGPVLACKQPREFQVEMKAERETIVPGKPGGDSAPLPSTFYRVRETGDGYQLLSASAKADPRCSGPNLMHDEQ